jgi:hypothetical protein
MENTQDTQTTNNTASYCSEAFREKTNNQQRLLDMGYTKTSLVKNPKKDTDYYLSKTFKDKTIVFTSQEGFKTYMKKKYGVIKSFHRNPDEAYIIEYNNGKIVIKILDKKEQTAETGDLECFIFFSTIARDEYQMKLGFNFKVLYGFCINNAFKDALLSTRDSDIKRYNAINQILKDNSIAVLSGDSEDYYEKLNMWYSK